MPFERLSAEGARGAKGTAAKILYLVRDLVSETANPNYSFSHWFKKDTKFIAATDVLVKGDELIAAQERAFVTIIDYIKYQKLIGANKDEVKNLIAKKLCDESKKYDTNYYIEIFDGPSSSRGDDRYVGKGLQYNSKQGTEYPDGYGGNWARVLSVCYPEELFLDQKKLAEFMVHAIGRKYLSVLTTAGLAIYMGPEGVVDKILADDFRKKSGSVHQSIAYSPLFNEVPEIRAMIADYLSPPEDERLVLNEEDGCVVVDQPTKTLSKTM